MCGILHTQRRTVPFKGWNWVVGLTLFLSEGRGGGAWMVAVWWVWRRRWLCLVCGHWNGCGCGFLTRGWDSAPSWVSEKVAVTLWTTIQEMKEKSKMVLYLTQNGLCFFCASFSSCGLHSTSSACPRTLAAANTYRDHVPCGTWEYHNFFLAQDYIIH